MLNFLRFFIQISILLVTVNSAPDTLRFVEIWFRHGERLPTNFPKFKTDPPLKFDYADLAYPSEMTKRGIQQEYNLGQYFRDIYGDFLGETYRPPQLYVSHGVDNRTSVSAEAMMAGLFPPKNGQIWNPQLLWQPIAMHTDETLDQVSTGISGPCPVYTETVWNDRRYKDIEKYIDPLVVQLLRNRTGEYLRDGHWLNKAIDSVKSRYYINDSRYEVPDWAAPHIDKFIKSSLNFHTEMLNIQNDTVGAFHLELIMSNVEEHLECRRDPEFQKKMVFFSGHDTNIMALMIALNMKYDFYDVPYFASHLAVELHEFDGQYFVEFWLSENMTAARTRLNPEFCTNPCSLNQLQEITKNARMQRPQFNFICSGVTKSLFEEKSNAIITGSMLILVAILLLSTIILGCTTYSYRKQLKQMQDPERRALLS